MDDPLTTPESALEEGASAFGRGRRRGVWRRTFEAAAYRDFRYLWVAQVSNAGAMWMMMVALPLLVLDMTGSVVQLGLVMSARTVPALFMGMFGGVAADMWNRRLILLITRAVATSIALWFTLMVMFDLVELWHVYLFVLMRGASQVFDQPARRAMIPSIVPENVITNAMALTSGSVQIMRVVSASAGGLVYGLASPATAFLVIAVLYALGIPLLVLLRPPDHERSGFTGLGPMVRDIREALAFAWRTPTVRGALFIASLYFTFGASFAQVFAPLIAQGPLGIEARGLGFLLAVMGIGALMGTFGLAFMNPIQRRGPMMLFELAAFGAILVAFAGSTYIPGLWLEFVVVWFVGVAQSAFLPLFSSVLLESAPTDMRGRVMALLGFDQALVTLGAAASGFSAALLGSQIALIAFGGACILGALVLAGYPPVRRIS